MIYVYRFTTTFSDFKVLRLLIHYIRLTITFLFVEPRFRYPFFSPLSHDSQAWESLVGSPVAGALGGLSPQMYDMPVIHKKAWDKSQAYSLYYPKVCTLTPSGVPIKTVSVIFVNNPCSTTPVRVFNSAPNVTGSLIGNTSKSII